MNEAKTHYCILEQIEQERFFLQKMSPENKPTTLFMHPHTYLRMLTSLDPVLAAATRAHDIPYSYAGLGIHLQPGMQEDTFVLGRMVEVETMVVP